MTARKSLATLALFRIKITYVLNNLWGFYQCNGQRCISRIDGKRRESLFEDKDWGSISLEPLINKKFIWMNI